MRAAMVLAGLTTALLVTSNLPAEEVAWRTDYREAWRESRQKHCPLLLYVTRSEFKYCDRMKDVTFHNSRLAAEVRDNFVAVSIDADLMPEYVKELKVDGFPTLLVFSPDAGQLDRIQGFIAHDALVRRLNLAHARHVMSVGQDATLRR